MTSRTPPILLAYAFRPFFLLTALYAVLSILLWVSVWQGLVPPLAAPLTPQWHAHEMLYGFVPAAIAGFLLTAITNWTGAAPLAGGRLAALVALWLLGRAAMWSVGLLPYGLIAAVDGAFLPVLALYVLGVLLRAGNRRNILLVVVLAVLACGNLLMHAGVLWQQPSLVIAGRTLGLDLVTVLMVVVAGRITPAFTANWLRMHRGLAVTPPRPWLTPLAVATVALMALASLAGLPAALVATLALLAALANALRLAFWSGWRVWREPLLWVLHLAYAGIVLALLSRGLYLLGVIDNPSLWYHMLGLAAIGILILGVMTRVSVGHTGRQMQLFRGAIWIYVAIIAATLLRLATAAALIGYALGLWLSALAWCAAFVLFIFLYGPALCQPRPDGRPG